MQDWKRLGHLLRERRRELGYGTRRRADFAALAGLSDRTLAGLEKGDPATPTRSTKARLETACQWERGSIDAILAGADPVVTEPVTAPVLRGRNGDMNVVAADQFELAIMQSDRLTDAEKAHAIALWREEGKARADARLAEYGLGPAGRADEVRRRSSLPEDPPRRADCDGR